MKHSEPLFISSADMDRHCKAAKELRSQYLRDIAEGIRRKIMPQKQSVVFVEAFVVVTLLVICVYWATFIGSLEATEAGSGSAMSPEQLTINTSRQLPTFEDAYRRHTGVLDTLE